jgi:hypothetical protein
MSESKHTPGPWNVDKDMIRAVDPITSIACICDVAWPLGNRQECPEANAHLIAAAPDLLDALEAAKQFIQNGIQYGYINMPDKDCGDSALETPAKIEAAIQKARGLQQ